jgi:hypothetical protein
MLSPSRSSFCFVLATAALIASCNTGPNSGTLSVSYELGLQGTCAGFGVATVKVTLDDGEYEEEEPCDPANPILLTGVAAGNYDVLVEGIDAEGITVMDNIGGDDDNSVEVVGGSDKELDVTLGDSPAQVQVRWLKFVNGEPAECAFIATKYFEVTAYHDATQFPNSNVFDCSVPPGYQTLPDPDRVIDGNTLNGVRVRVLDESEEQIGDDLVFAGFDPPGAGRVVQIDITCDGPENEPVCTGELVGIGGADTGADSGSTDDAGESTG